MFVKQKYARTLKQRIKRFDMKLETTFVGLTDSRPIPNKYLYY
jgi:hypothetical protein